MNFNFVQRDRLVRRPAGLIPELPATELHLEWMLVGNSHDRSQKIRAIYVEPRYFQALVREI